MPPIRRNALGRGLDSLISMDDVPARGSSAINDIDVTLISLIPTSRVQHSTKKPLTNLLYPCRELGIIQPLSLRKDRPRRISDCYCRRAPLPSCNQGRADISARIYARPTTASSPRWRSLRISSAKTSTPLKSRSHSKKLIDQYRRPGTTKRTHRKKTRPIANFLRLLKLPAEVQLGLRDKRVDMGHARALLSIEKPALQLKLYNEILRQGLSVRKVEELAKAYRETDEAGEEAPAAKKADNRTNDYDILKKHLSASFRRPVQFTCNAKGKGKIAFPFKNEDELEQLIAIFDTIKHSEG